MAKRKDLLEVPMTISWHEKPNRKYFLEHLIKKHNITTMAEIGVRDGRTTFYLLDNIPELTIYGVDLSVSGFYSQQIQEKYGDRLIAIQGNSYQVCDQIPTVGLVFIDADHSYKGVYKDIMAYKNKAQVILSGHDIDYPGVNTAVNELIVDYEVGPNNVWFTKI